MPLFGMGNGLNTGPSPSFMARLAGGLNNAAQGFGDPQSQQIAKQTGGMGQVGQMNRRRNQKSGTGVPVNGPKGMTPATNIMRTPGGAPNPYNSGGGDGGESKDGNNLVMGPSIMPFGQMPPTTGMPPTSMYPNMPQVPGMGMGAPGMGGGGFGQASPQFWNQYNQNRPPMMG